MSENETAPEAVKTETETEAVKTETETETVATETETVAAETETVTTEALAEEYEDQSLPASAHIVYKPKDGVVEGDPHFGDPGCYGCCGFHCCVELIVVLAVVLVCCAYGTDGTCCDYCYWPF